MARKDAGWTRDQLLVAFRLYCRTPFGKLHRGNPEIIALARLIGRTPSAVGMKACNFAALDPAQQARGIKALGNLSRADRILWEEFALDSEAVAAQAESAYERFVAGVRVANDESMALPDGPTETARLVRIRRVQGFFRESVLSAYEGRCALTGLALPEVLNASHIIPWRVEVNRRADPRNGLCLNALHDRAFDRGLITFDEQWKMVVSPRVDLGVTNEFARHSLVNLAGSKLRLPNRFQPDPVAISYHREHVYRDG
ncbi:MAG: HNH endonuclease signature motif containing protein [Planctomycetota bacterium]|nr:HNH endonuclease signature motif containing protein [Planctomycetota bacterium]